MLKNYRLIAASLVLILLSGLLWAQSEEPTSTEEAAAETVATEEAGRSPEDCSELGLIAARNEIDALLDNFDREALLDPETALANLYTVGEQYRQLALDCGYLPANLDTLVIGTTDVAQVLTALETLNGDPLRGQLVYNGEEPTTNGDRLGCSGCHEGAASIAPHTEGTWTRWDETTGKQARFADYTFEQYIVESILLPWEYFVPTYPEYTMPDFYHEQLGYQDLADIVAYLNSQDQLLETD